MNKQIAIASIKNRLGFESRTDVTVVRFLNCEDGIERAAMTDCIAIYTDVSGNEATKKLLRFLKGKKVK